MDKVVEVFLLKLKKNFQVEKAILFGSRARGDHLSESDYDFVIVSKDFSKMDFLDRIKAVIRRCDAFFNADFLCYTPEEFEKKRKQIGIVGEAVREGKFLIGQ
ncbi:nucleotidyltransferase domain-containing protein [Candidatus Micrarchaeota archaeon]|nr:nucleotidyltransferase domain-containing protein [Candidatus Micrarchaeota archaeon]